MTVTTVLIAIAAALIGFVIGLIIGMAEVPPKPGCKTLQPTPEKDKTIPEPVVTTIIIPKRIGCDAFTKRVNRAVRDTVIKAFSACQIQYNDETVDHMMIKVLLSLPCLKYDEYRPQFQRLDIVGRTCANLDDGINPNDLYFDAAWSKKTPSDVSTYVKRGKKSSKKMVKLIIPNDVLEYAREQNNKWSK